MPRLPFLISSLCLASLFLGACSPAHPIARAANVIHATFTLPAETATATGTPPAAAPSQTHLPSPTRQPSPEYTATITPTPTISPTATQDTRLPASLWRNWPIVPTLTARALEIYRKGQQSGNDPHSFIRIGDCQSEPEVFLGIYDDPTRYYFDKKFGYLQLTVNQFAGSFSRVNVTARRGFGVASVFSPLQNDPKLCSGSETPLECEYRLHKPVMAFISMGTNWCKGCSAKFEEYLRQIVDFSIQNGIIPILSTKADDAEGDNSLNEAVAKVAYDEDLPMWNFWKAVQYLPNHGLEEDNIYLTVEGWNERSFTGLQTLDSLWTAIQAAH